VVIGVFDGLHLGHAYLLDHLVREAAERDARPTVITFDHHPDEVLMGKAPPLLLDPAERLERLDAAGVAVTVVQAFDEALRQTPYDTFVERIRAQAQLTGFLMTPDAAFGFERRGTPEALAGLGERDVFDVVVVPTFSLDGKDVRSSTIRDAIVSGDLATAARLLGRPVTLTGFANGATNGMTRLDFALPVALPPDGDHEATVDGRPLGLRIVDGEAYLVGDISNGRVTVVLERSERASTAQDLRRRIGIFSARSSGFVEPIAFLPGGFTGLVMSFATRLTAFVPGGGLVHSPLRLRWRSGAREQSGDLRQDRHQAPGSHSGSATPRSWFS
jgi:hypothetical protein